MRIYSSSDAPVSGAILPNTVADYEESIQTGLSAILVDVPVYKNYNRNFAQEPTFATWQLRSLARQVFTGKPKVLGIAMPHVQVSIFSQDQNLSSDLANEVIYAWNGYTGYINPNQVGIVCGKVTVDYVYQTFDDKYNLTQTVLDVALYVTGAPNNFS